MAGFLIFLASIGGAAIWETLEFSLDIILGQDALGYATAELIAQMNALGLSGVQRSLYKLQRIPMWDTVTDMPAHVIAAIFFLLQYLLHRKTKKT